MPPPGPDRYTRTETTANDNMPDSQSCANDRSVTPEPCYQNKIAEPDACSALYAVVGDDERRLPEITPTLASDQPARGFEQPW